MNAQVKQLHSVVSYILDTFPIVKRKDEARTAEKNAAGEVVIPGRYITKGTILEICDHFAKASSNRTAFISPLNPPLGDIRACHPPKS